MAATSTNSPSTFFWISSNFFQLGVYFICIDSYISFFGVDFFRLSPLEADFLWLWLTHRRLFLDSTPTFSASTATFDDSAPTSSGLVVTFPGSALTFPAKHRLYLVQRLLSRHGADLLWHRVCFFPIGGDFSRLSTDFFLFLEFPTECYISTKTLAEKNYNLDKKRNNTVATIIINSCCLIFSDTLLSSNIDR